MATHLREPCAAVPQQFPSFQCENTAALSFVAKKRASRKDAKAQGKDSVSLRAFASLREEIVNWHGHQGIKALRFYAA
jgi:hypothetical protein